VTVTVTGLYAYETLRLRDISPTGEFAYYLYRHRISDAAPSQTLSGAHPPIVVIRESGLTIIELELELESGHFAYLLLRMQSCYVVYALKVQ